MIIIIIAKIKRLNADSVTPKKVAKRFRHDNTDTFFEDIGKGRINERQLTSAIQSELKPENTQSKQQRTFSFSELGNVEDAKAYVIGAIHLTTNLAPCCSPKPYDDIVGYVTRGRGITVHKHDCANILNLSHDEQRRLIEVTWSKKQAEEPCFTAELQVVAFDRKGLLRDVMATLTKLDINLTASNTQTNTQENSVNMLLTLELEYATNLGDLLDHIEMIPNIESVSIKTV